MRADLDLLCISVYCTADDLLPARPGNGRRKLTDAEIVTLCVAQVLMGIPSDRRFLRAAQPAARAPVSRGCPARTRCTNGGPGWPTRSSGCAVSFAAQCPGASDDLVLLDSTPVECGRSLETTRRSAAGRRLRLRLLQEPLPLVLGHAAAPGLRPRRHPESGHARRRRPSRTRGRAAAAGARPPRRRDDRLRQGLRRPRVRAGRRATSAALIVRPARKDEPDTGVHLAPIRQRIESRLPAPAKTSSASNATAPAPHATSAPASQPGSSRSPPASDLNHQLGRPSRALADYTA